ncbi:MAG: DUF389 domain-containing protein [Bacteroidaceae bacterium]|nr:DUF389 domain-containing protein [Bacteroidaceae bacterium]
MDIFRELRTKLGDILGLGDDMAPAQETIDAITDGVVFRGAKLWILVLAVFVASLGLNTNSAAVIIGAMLISPLMGPIIGMGLGVGINDFMLFKRAAKNYIVATLFSVTTATVYFLVTPLAEVQSELLARTSPTIYDVAIALCGGLAGIVALSSRSQRTGNVIPGVAIATALMPPLCTVGFGLGTGNWIFALGALYLYLINTIFISLATFLGVTLVMRFPKKMFVDKAREKRVKHIITFICVITIIPSIFITLQMVRATMFTNKCHDFCCKHIHVNEAKVISRDFDFDNKVIRVQVLGEEMDSVQIAAIESRLSDYGLEDVRLDIVQGNKSIDMESVRGMIHSEKNRTLAAQRQLVGREQEIKELRDSLAMYRATLEQSRALLPELSALFPVCAVSTGRGVHAYATDSAQCDSAVYVVDIVLDARITAKDEARLESWLNARLSREDLMVILRQKVRK